MAYCRCLRCGAHVFEGDGVQGWLMLKRMPNNNAEPVPIINDLQDIWCSGTIVEYPTHLLRDDFDLMGLCPACRLNEQPEE
jgi:hypothetical protein